LDQARPILIAERTGMSHSENRISHAMHPALLERLADTSYRHRQSVLGVWMLLLVALVSVASFGELDNDFDVAVFAVAAAIGAGMTLLAAGTVRADRSEPSRTPRREESP
jgi:hypothetical protein